jgi:hypothetical protein
MHASKRVTTLDELEQVFVVDRTYTLKVLKSNRKILCEKLQNNIKRGGIQYN